MKKLKSVVYLCIILAVLSAGGLFYYQKNIAHAGKGEAASLDALADQTIQTNQISTNLNSDNLIQVKFSIELDSMGTKKQAEKIVPIIESDIIKILSLSKKEDFKDIAAFEKKVTDRLNERFTTGKIKHVYTTELLIQ
ncbi:flagellar basal body-associated FliL family protein [Neobacillus soli]|nr:flagellar basal body-associated FliL family protein [Neobacillus soli]